jgi:hypothetical protein
MALTPKSRRALQAAFVAAFPDGLSLQPLAASVFGRVPESLLAAGSDLAMAVAALLAAAEDQDQVIELVCAAHEQHPGQEALRRVINSIEQMEPLPPLPARDPVFVGREADVAAACRLVETAAPEGGIVLLVGPAGIGKTQLALAVAAHLAPRFPDGQVWVALRGSGPTPLSPEYALAGVMHRFHSRLHLPARQEHLETTYRGYVLQETQTLILADDAADAALLAALRPPPGCVLLVTSRLPLTLLYGQIYYLDPLPLMVTARLLQETAPVSSTDAETLAQLAAGVPLALRLLAADRRAHLNRPLRDYHVAIQAAPAPVAGAQWSAPIITGVLTLLWETLPIPERRALAHLSLFVADFDVEAAAAILGRSPGSAAAVLDSLQQRHLIHHDSDTGRYQIHTPIQTFAMRYLDPAMRYATQLRMAQHYLIVAQQVQQWLAQSEAAMAAGDYTTTGRLWQRSADLFTREQPHLDTVEAWLLAGINETPALDRLLLDYLAAITPIRRRRFAKRRTFVPGWIAWLAAAERLGDHEAAQTAREHLGQRYLQPDPPAPPFSAAIPPTALLPQAFGWAWGWRQQPDCPAPWPVVPSYCTAGFVTLTLPAGGAEREMELFLPILCTLNCMYATIRWGRRMTGPAARRGCFVFAPISRAASCFLRTI